MSYKKRKPKLYFWRNRVIVPLLLFLIGTPVVWLMDVRYRRYKPKSRTFLLVANHGDTLDPAYEILALGRYIRFVCADYIARSGLSGRLLSFFATPIIKHRDRPREELTGEILEDLRAGVSVGLHAEGGTSINGETRFIPRNTARLAKESGQALITFRNTGGYLRSPRWMKSRRRGRLTCQVVHEYSPEELRAMTEDQVYEAICRDLYVNCYDQQRQAPRPYRGKALAENCEIVLYRCPACGAAGRLTSRGDTLRCSCGLEARLGEDGLFRGDGLRFTDICAWEHWQRETIGELVGSCGDGPIFRDEGQLLTRVVNGVNTPVSREAVLTLCRDRLELSWEGNCWSAKLSDLERLEYGRRMSLLVVTRDDYFDVSSTVPRSPTKYVDAWRYLMGKPNL